MKPAKLYNDDGERSGLRWIYGLIFLIALLAVSAFVLGAVL